MDAATCVTDDELVAIAIDAGVEWPLPLPTVAAETPGELRAAAFRGVRSLGARGAIIDGELDGSLQTLACVSGNTASFLVYLGDELAEVIEPFAGYGVVAAGAGWLVDEISSIGTHRFSMVEDKEELQSWVLALLSDRPSEAPPICLAVPSESAVVAVVAAGREASLVKISEDSTVTKEMVSDLEAVVGALFRSI